MNLNDCYRILDVPVSSTSDQVVRAYKNLARKYHPDKNPHRLEWAHEMMTALNNSYAMLMAHLFKEQTEEEDAARRETPPAADRRPRAREAGSDRAERAEEFKKEIERDILIGKFIKNRETAKESLYRYFQYSLHNLARRESVLNRGIFNEIVFSIRKNYHAIRSYLPHTSDRELIEHFETFSSMLFNFYRASECLNILDSYNNLTDVEAYRQYKRGDEALHIAQKELFYDRHNRGVFKKDIAAAYILKAEDDFNRTLRRYPDSSWAVETSIKLEYVVTLKNYLELFFNE